MLLRELMGLWLDSARKRLRESTVVSYQIAMNKAVKYLGGKEIFDEDCAGRRTPSRR